MIAVNNTVEEKIGNLTISANREKIKIEHNTAVGSQKLRFHCLRFDPILNQMAVGCSDGSIRIYDLKQHKLRAEMVGSKQYSMVIGLKYRSDQKYIQSYNSHLLVSCSYDGSICGYHVQTGKQMYQYKFDNPAETNNGILTMDISRDGDTMMLAGEQSQIYHLDQQSSKIKATFKPGNQVTQGHTNRIFTARYLKQEDDDMVNRIDSEQLFVSAGWDQNIILWDSRQPTPVGSVYGPNLAGESVDFIDNQMITGSNRTRDQLEVWDINSLNKLANVDWDHQKDSSLQDSNTAYVYSLRINKHKNYRSKQNMFIAGIGGQTGNDNEVRLFQQVEQQSSQYSPIARIFGIGGVYCSEFSKYKQQFAVAGEGGVVNVFDYS